MEITREDVEGMAGGVASRRERRRARGAGPTTGGTRELAIHLSGRRIGAVFRTTTGRAHFAFDQAYMDDPDRPTLSLSFWDPKCGLLPQTRNYNASLPPFFANLLPEGLLRRFLARRAGVSPLSQFPLLEALGEDLPGAATAHCEDDRGRTEPGGGPDGRALRFSVAGVQMKFSAVRDPSGRLSVPADGVGGDWIVKFPLEGHPGLAENEFALMELARRIGIDVRNARLVSVEKIDGLPDEVRSSQGNAFAIERFDRTPDGARIHMEDFAQVFGMFPDKKYEKRNYAHIAMVLAAEIGSDAVTEFVRRLAFSVVIGNGDMHLKNWSVLYPDGRRPALAPAYDYLSTVPYGYDMSTALRFGKSKSLTDITPDQVRRFAEAAGASAPALWETARRTVEETRDAWVGSAERDLLPAEVRESLNAHIEAVARNVSSH